MKLLLYPLIFSFLLVACTTSTKKNEKAEKASAQEANTISTDCAHCGMPSLDYPQWHAEAITDAGKALHFCSPRCFFIHFQDTSLNLKAKEARVTDYYTTQKVDAFSAYYVVGSNKTGPMGWDVVPFGQESDAEAFKQDYKGKQILRYEAISPELIQKVIKNEIE
jgi:nitrous oxide reductase accessory protein NosL